MTGPHELVRLRSVGCAYGAAPALADVDLTIDSRQFSAVVGPSGAGKTTLLRLLIGSIEPSSGSIVRKADLRVGYVPQVDTVNWSFPLTVSECVLMARTAGRVLPWRSKSESREVGIILDRLGIADLAKRHIRELSGGQQQRMFIARALLSEPDLLLMDEPTSGVDAKTRHDILHLLEDLHDDGLAIVLTTHDLNGMAAHLPHLICLNKSVIAEGSAKEVLVPEVLENTYGATMDVLEHAGMHIVLDRFSSRAESAKIDVRDIRV